MISLHPTFVFCWRKCTFFFVCFNAIQTEEFHRIYKQDKILLILVLTFFVVGRKVNHTKEYTNMNLWFIMFEFVLVHNLKKKKS